MFREVRYINRSALTERRFPGPKDKYSVNHSLIETSQDEGNKRQWEAGRGKKKQRNTEALKERNGEIGQGKRW